MAEFVISKDGTTYLAAPKTDPLDNLLVEVGDSKQSSFQPQVKVLRWNNEVNFSARVADFTDGVVEQTEGLIKYVASDREAHLYDLPVSADHPEGGFEIEVLLKEPPPTNVITFTLQQKGVRYVYQPELTQEEIDGGAFRPENVVGSYVVEHSGDCNNFEGGTVYRTGKVAHIYRPKITDSKENWTWGELSIDEYTNLLTVTIPQEFLDSAAYPVLVDPTFGYSTIGATTATFTDNGYGESLFTAPSDIGIVNTISMYGHTAILGQFKGLLHLHSDLSLVASGSAQAMTAGLPNATWWDSEISSPPTLSASTDYLIGAVHDVTGGVNTMFYDTGSTDQGHTGSQAGLYATPAAITSPTHSTRKYSIYATYVPGYSSAHPDDTIALQTTLTTNVSYKRLCSSTLAIHDAGLYDPNLAALERPVFALRTSVSDVVDYRRSLSSTLALSDEFFSSIPVPFFRLVSDILALSTDHHLLGGAKLVSVSDVLALRTTPYRALQALRLVSANLGLRTDDPSYTMIWRRVSDDVLALRDAYTIFASGPATTKTLTAFSNLAFRDVRTETMRWRIGVSSNLALHDTLFFLAQNLIHVSSTIAFDDPVYAWQVPWQRVLSSTLALTHPDPAYVIPVPFRVALSSVLALSTTPYAWAVPWKRTLSSNLALATTESHVMEYNRFFQEALALATTNYQDTVPWRRILSSTLALSTTAAQSMVFQRMMSSVLALHTLDHERIIWQRLLDDTLALHTTEKHGVLYIRQFDDVLALHDSVRRKVAVRRLFSSVLALSTDPYSKTLKLLMASSTLALHTTLPVPSEVFHRLLDDVLALSDDPLMSYVYRLQLSSVLALGDEKTVKAVFNRIVSDVLALHDNVKRAALLLRLALSTLALADEIRQERFVAGSTLLLFIMMHEFMPGRDVKEVVYGSTNVSAEGLRALDSTNGAPRTDIAYNSTGYVPWYRRSNGAVIPITPVNLASLEDAHTDGGTKHINNGYFRVDVPDAAFATGADNVLVGATCTGMVIIAEEFDLVPPPSPVTISPEATNASQRRDADAARLFIDETNTFSWPPIVSGAAPNQTPVDLTLFALKELRVAAEDRRVLRVYVNSEITADGDDNNIPTTPLDSKITEYEGKLLWTLRDTTPGAEVVLGWGTGESFTLHR